MNNIGRHTLKKLLLTSILIGVILLFIFPIRYFYRELIYLNQGVQTATILAQELPSSSILVLKEISNRNGLSRLQYITERALIDHIELLIDDIEWLKFDEAQMINTRRILVNYTKYYETENSLIFKESEINYVDCYFSRDDIVKLRNDVNNTIAKIKAYLASHPERG